jgi:23S rRNA (guanosine2251-2'-O)-methyltransferase
MYYVTLTLKNQSVLWKLGKMVGDPGVRAFLSARLRLGRRPVNGERRVAKKPAWIIDKERGRKAAAAETFWLFGIHAVRDALGNPARSKLRLVVTRNALDRLGDAVPASGLEPEIADPRRFPVPLDPGSVHQGAALEVRALDWGGLADVALAEGQGAPRLVLLDRVSDPHNVGAILRSAEVFGARAVVAPARHSAPETGALAKTASGALERQPYLRVPNLGNAIETLKDMGYLVIGLDGEGPVEIAEAADQARDRPAALVLGAEGPGLRARTRDLCDVLARIPAAGGFGSLNVSNAAAVSLYALKTD